MQDVMIDLETLGTAADSAILSLGAVVFDPTTTKIDDNGYYAVISLESNLSAGRTISESTVAWWMQQSPAAQTIFHSPNKLPLLEVLEEFSDWLSDKDYTVWSNGADFDLPMLAHAYARAGLKVPWRYSNTRCFRTLKNLPGAGKAKMPPQNDNAHNAFSDAIWQAQATQALYSALFKK